jgi:hypothetical protein
VREKILALNTKYQSKVAELLLELEQYQETVLNRQPASGAWSAMQTAWHLLYVEEGSMKYVQKKLGYGGHFEKAGISAWLKMALLHMTMRLPIKFKAPAASSSDELPSDASLAELTKRWQAIHLAWNRFFEELPDDLLDKTVYKHPRAGRISWLQMLDFFDMHFDRHLQQVRGAIGRMG